MLLHHWAAIEVMGIKPHHVVVTLLHLRWGAGLATVVLGVASSSSV
jgi:hypothetical protein